jgi:hypothetical protein
MGKNVGEFRSILFPESDYLAYEIVGIIRRNLGNLQKIETKLITPFLPRLLGTKGLLLREVDEMAIRSVICLGSSICLMEYTVLLVAHLLHSPFPQHGTTILGHLTID